MNDDDVRSRNTDPHTSHDAAESIEDSTALLRLVYHTVEASGIKPLTQEETAHIIQLTHPKIHTHTVTPRFATLESRGQVVVVTTKPGPTGRQRQAYIAKRFEAEYWAAQTHLEPPPDAPKTKKQPSLDQRVLRALVMLDKVMKTIGKLGLNVQIEIPIGYVTYDKITLDVSKFTIEEKIEKFTNFAS